MKQSISLDIKQIISQVDDFGFKCVFSLAEKAQTYCTKGPIQMTDHSADFVNYRSVHFF